jgi:hypothetical protein
LRQGANFDIGLMLEERMPDTASVLSYFDPRGRAAGE